VKTPKPTTKETVCDLCGLDWNRHGKNPTAEKCIELLKADLAVAQLAPIRPIPYPYPVAPNPYPAPQPIPYPGRPYRMPWSPQSPYWQTTNNFALDLQ
jgi:hypothetical protein